VGLHEYTYPGGNLTSANPPLGSRGFNTLEWHAALTWKWLTLTYNSSLTDYFGADTEEGYKGNSKGTSYLQADASIPINDTWSLALHAAHTNYPTQLAAPLASGATDPSYNDYNVTLKWQFTPIWFVSFQVSEASNSAFYDNTVSFRNSDTKNVGDTRGVLTLEAAF
jgi:uncharacterized protein (TIGR02001 family)